MHRRLFLSQLGGAAGGLFIQRQLTANIWRAQPAQTGNVQAVLRIGVLSVTKDPSPGLQMGYAEAQHTAALLNMNVELIAVRADADATITAATELLQDRHASAIIGGEDVAACTALANVAAKHDAIYMNTACSTNELRESGCNRHAFHVAPSDRMLQDARAAAAEGDPACVSWHDSLSRYGADTLNARFRAKFGQPMSERDWNDWFAIKVLWETFARAKVTGADAWIRELEKPTTRFDGHKGKQLSFRSWDHQLRQPLYLQSANSAGSVTVTEVPGAQTGDMTAAATLDGLGADPLYRTCRWVAGS